MAHKFNGTWNHFLLSKAPFPQAGPQQRLDFRLFIDDDGNFDLDKTRVDGRKIKDASVDGETSFAITAQDGRQYKGFLVKEDVGEDGSSVMVIAGRHKDPKIQPTKTKGGKDEAPAADAAPTGQNEGDWVITKP